jgi:hypothetical protein
MALPGRRLAAGVTFLSLLFRNIGTFLRAKGLFLRDYCCGRTIHELLFCIAAV